MEVKIAKVKYLKVPKASIQEGFIVENETDLSVLNEILQQSKNSSVTKMVKSGERPDRYDHVIGGFKPVERAISTLACFPSIVDKNSNPIFHLPFAMSMYLRTAIALLEKHSKIFINSVGGICPLNDTDYEIVSVEVKPYGMDKTYRIPKNTKVINLENDCELERPAINYMIDTLRDPNYSYIKEMRLLSKNNMTGLFRQFVNNGGETVYVYTTGQDVPQMYEYTDAAINAGLVKFIFHFNIGMNDAINTFIETIKSNPKLSVTLVN